MISIAFLLVFNCISHYISNCIFTVFLIVFLTCTSHCISDDISVCSASFVTCDLMDRYPTLLSALCILHHGGGGDGDYAIMVVMVMF